MTRPSTAPVPSIRARDAARQTNRNEPQPDWADAETRSFLERPSSATSCAGILRVAIITAMVVAAVKVAWILVLR